MKKLHLFLFFIFIFSIGIAQTHVWTGNGGDNNWFTTANWDVNTVPDNSSEVLIDGAFSVVIANNTADASTIDVLKYPFQWIPGIFLW